MVFYPVRDFPLRDDVVRARSTAYHWFLCVRKRACVNRYQRSRLRRKTPAMSHFPLHLLLLRRPLHCRCLLFEDILNSCQVDTSPRAAVDFVVCVRAGMSSEVPAASVVDGQRGVVTRPDTALAGVCMKSDVRRSQYNNT